MNWKPLTEVLRRYERTSPAEWLCLQFAFEGAAATGGRDLMPLVPAHRTKWEALRELRRSGFKTLIELMDAHATPIKPAHARTGSVAYLDQAPIGAMGVVVGGEALFLGPAGYRRHPVSPDLFFWSLN